MKLSEVKVTPTRRCKAPDWRSSADTRISVICKATWRSKKPIQE
jgi:hypothetical protein